MSLDYSGLERFFRNLPNSNPKYMSVFYEFPVLERYPFYRINGVLRCWHSVVFFRGSAGLVHSVLSEHSSNYMESFSKVFEQHCVNLARLVGGTHHTDEELKRYLPKNSKNPDCMLSYTSCNIFIEIKSGIFRQSVMTVGNRDVFRNKTKALRTAVTQAWEASEGLREKRLAPAVYWR